jgi:hypothetical protein
MNGTYEVEDIVLPHITFPKKSRVRIVIDDKFVRLYVGPRDWQFDRDTKECVGSGVNLCVN